MIKKNKYLQTRLAITTDVKINCFENLFDYQK